MKSAVAALFILSAMTLTMGCHKTAPPQAVTAPAPVQWEYQTFKLLDVSDRLHNVLMVYDHINTLVLSNNVTSGTEVLNSIAPYGWELVTINNGEYNVKRPHGTFTNILFFITLDHPFD